MGYKVISANFRKCVLLAQNNCFVLTHVSIEDHDPFWFRSESITILGHFLADSKRTDRPEKKIIPHNVIVSHLTGKF